MEQPRACSAWSGDTVVALDGIWGETRARNLECRSEEQRRMKRERERQYTQRVDDLRTAQQIQLIVDTDNSLKHPDSSGEPPGDPSTNAQADTQVVPPKPSAENLLQLNPSSSLDFRRPLTTLTKCPLTITNNNLQPVASKVKTTASKLYCVRPNSGRVEPGESIDVSVMLQALKEEPPKHIKCKDKFLIQSTIITPDKETLPLADIWASPETKEEGKVFQQKLRVTYVSAEGQVPEEDEDNQVGMMSMLSDNDQLYDTVRQPRAANGHPGIDSQLLTGVPADYHEDRAPTPGHDAIEHQESQDSHVTAILPPHIPTIVDILNQMVAEMETLEQQLKQPQEAAAAPPPVQELRRRTRRVSDVDSAAPSEAMTMVEDVVPIHERPPPPPAVAPKPDLRPSTPALTPIAASAEQVAEQADNTATLSEALHMEKPQVPEPIIISWAMTEMEGMHAPTRDHGHQESQYSYVTAVLPPQIPTIVEPPPASEANVRPSTPTLAPTPAAEQVVEQADNTTTLPEALHIEKPPVLIEPIIVSCENSIYEELFAKFNQVMTEMEGMQTLIATLQQQAQEAPPHMQGFRRRTRRVSDADSAAPTEAITFPEDLAPIQQEGVPLNVQAVVVIVLLMFITTYFFFTFISGKMNC